MALAGCAAPEPNWEKTGASQTAVNEAMQQCRMDTRVAARQHVDTPRPHSSGAPFMDRQDVRDTEEPQRFQKCMTDKGYSLKP